MTYSLYSNIFKPGSEEQLRFARFPVQVTILHSLRDTPFIDTFTRLFGKLDQYTGTHVVLFPVLPPPDPWLIEQPSRAKWWYDYHESLGRNPDQAGLMHELARLFGVPWSDLPVLVISPNLWTGEYIVVPTSADAVERQIIELTDLVKRIGQPTMTDIKAMFRESGVPASYHRSKRSLGDKLQKLYGVLESKVSGSKRDITDALDIALNRYASLIGRDEIVSYIKVDISADNMSPEDRIGAQELRQDRAQVKREQTIDDVTGLLLAVSPMVEPAASPVMIDGLEDESQIMLNTAQAVSQLIQSQLPTNRLRLDYSAPAQGLWKALENEINYSLLQAARASRGIPMPEYFMRWMQTFAKDKGMVSTGSGGQTRKFNLNKKDIHSTRNLHQLFTLGDAWHIISAMLQSPQERLANDLQSMLGTPLPTDLLQRWQDVYNIRNRGSHPVVLDQIDHGIVEREVLHSDMLPTLVRVKNALKVPISPS